MKLVMTERRKNYLVPKGKKKEKSNWINERWISWRNYDRICLIKSKHIELVKRQQWWGQKSKRHKKT